MKSSAGPDTLLQTLWALGTVCLLGASLMTALASFLVPIQPSTLVKLLLLSVVAWVINFALNKERN